MQVPNTTGVLPAVEIVQKLKANAPSFIGGLLDNYKTLMSAYIDLANASTSALVQKSQTKNVNFSSIMEFPEQLRLTKGLG